MGQPQRQSDERAEHEKVVKRKAPDLQIFQRRELLRQGWRLGARFASGDQLRIVLRQKEEQHPQDRQSGRPDIGHPVPAIGNHDEGGHELGHSRPDIACAENAKRGALMARVIPAADIGNADDEGPARKPDAQGRDQIHDISIRQRKRPGSNRCQKHLTRKYQPTAIFFGPDPKEQAGHGAGQNWRRHKQPELRVTQAQLGLDGDANDRKNRPNRETGGKGDRAQAQGARLIGA